MPPWMTILGRRVGTRFPALVGFVQWWDNSRFMARAGRVVRLVLVSSVIALMMFGGWALVAGLLDLIGKHQETIKDAGLGLLGLAFYWMASWPGYVWLGLLALLVLGRIGSQLERLNRRVHGLTEAVRSLKKTDGDSEDEWDSDGE